MNAHRSSTTAAGLTQKLAARWALGETPDLCEFLTEAGAGDLSAEQRLALIRVDQEQRWQRGETVAAERYLEFFPTLATDDQAVLDLIYSEILVREHQHEAPTLAEYLHRFPQYAVQLRRQFEVHEALRSDPGLDESLRDSQHAAPETHWDAQPNSSHAATPSTPIQLPGYEIECELGRGGMGVVYRARDTQLKRVVALKVILPGTAIRDENYARFRREAEAIAQLQHPNIVQIHAIEEHAGQPVLVLEYVAGESLAQRLHGQPLPPRAAAELVETLARAIHYAHQRGIIHRDLKPTNVLLAEPPAPATASRPSDAPASGRGALGAVPKVTDFGLAKRVAQDGTLTRTGMIIGTPCYMAPEQARGDTAALDPRMDVYALGAILFETLTGRPPFQGPTLLDILDQLETRDPLPPRSLQPTVPRDLETICLCCLHKEPTQRYPHAAALADDLHRFLSDEPILARPASAWDHAQKWARRHPGVAALSAALTTVILVAMVLVFGQWQRAEDKAKSEAAAKNLAQANARLADQRRAEAEQQRRRALQTAARSALDRGLAWGEQHDPALCLLWLGRGLELVAGQDEPLERCFRQNLAGWAALTPRLTQAVTLPGSCQRLLLSENGRFAFTLAADRTTISRWDLPSGQPIDPGGTLTAELVAWAVSPAGNCLAVSTNSGLQLWDLDKHPSKPQTLTTRPGIGALAFNAAGTVLAAGSQEKTVQQWQVPGGEPWGSPRALDARVHLVAFSPDGQTLLTGCGDKAYRWRTDGQKPTVFAHAAYLTYAGFHPNGTQVLASDLSHLYLWEAATAKLISKTPHGLFSVDLAAIDEANQLLLTGSRDGVVQGWNLTAAGLTRRFQVRHARPIQGLVVTPQEHIFWSGSSDGRLRQWRIPDAAPSHRVLPHPDRVLDCAFHPAGQQALTVGQDKVVRRWSLEGKLLWQSAMSETPLSSAQFSPDGHWIAAWFSRSPTLLLWDATSDEATGRKLQHPGDLVQAVFTPDGQRLCTVDKTGAVRRWQVPSGTLLDEPFQTLGATQAAVIGPDASHILAWCGARDAHFWDAATGQTRRLDVPRPDNPLSAVLSPGGERGLVDDELWDLQSGQRLTAVGQLGPAAVRAFSPDGSKLVTADFAGEIRVWDAASGRSLGALVLRRSAVRKCLLSPDSTTVLSGCQDGVTGLGDLATLRAWGPLLPHGENLIALAASRDLRHVITGGGDLSARLWSLPQPLGGDPAALRRWTETVTGLEIDPRELVTILPDAEWHRRRLASDPPRPGGPP